MFLLIVWYITETLYIAVTLFVFCLPIDVLDNLCFLCLAFDSGFSSLNINASIFFGTTDRYAIVCFCFCRSVCWVDLSSSRAYHLLLQGRLHQQGLLLSISLRQKHSNICLDLCLGRTDTWSFVCCHQAYRISNQRYEIQDRVNGSIVDTGSHFFHSLLRRF